MAGLFDDLKPSEGGSEPLRLTVRPLDPRSRDLAIRTIYGEAANEPEEGLAGVAAVIRNRMQAGKYGGDNIESVVRAPNQFEPWNTPGGQFRMRSVREEDPKYQRIGDVVDRIFSGAMPDPTNGATHFFAPKAQAALGRNVPKWAQGEGLPIGNHTFYAPEGRVQVASGATAMPGQPAQTNAPPTRAGLFDDLISPLPSSTGLPGGLPPRAGREGVAPLAETVPVAPQAVPTSPAQRLAVDFQNQGSAAGQGTSPNVGLQSQNLISDQVHQSDSGELLYRDPATGQMVPTDQNKHVVLRDPADNTLKVFGRTADTDEGRLSAAGRLLMTGAASGAPTARAAIPAAPALQPKASDIFSASKPYYRAFTKEASDFSATPEAAAAIGDRIRGALDKANLIEELAKPVYSAIGILDKGDSLTLDALQNIKRVVGRSFNSPDKNIRDAAGVASREIAKIISETSPTAARNLKTADDIHSTARSVQDLQRKSDVADLRAGRAGYSGNAVNSMRQVLSPIVQKAVEGRLTGFKPDEIQAMREIVEGTTTTNALRGIGQLSPSKGIIQTLGAGGAYYAAGPAALAIPALGAASNKLATVLTGKQIDRLKELVSKRSPAYAEAVTKAVERYERAQLELINDPSPGRLAAYVTASRALSSGLSRDGVAVGAGDLMRSLQSGGISRTEDDQTSVPRPPGQ